MYQEKWKPVHGYEGYYEVSNLGNVRGVDRVVKDKSGNTRLVRGRKIAKSTHYRNGYMSVMLSRDCEQKRFTVHRLVAEAFVSNPHGYPEVNHKDENKENNAAENLEWCTHLYNNRYGTKQERLSKLRSRRVVMMRDGKALKTYPSETEAAAAVGGVQSGVSACCRGITSLYKGYEWAFA